MRHRSRCFSVFPDEDGMYVVRGRLDPEVGAMLMRALDAASDALFTAGTSEEIEPKQRRADAVGLLAERALAVGFGSEEDTPVSGTRAERYQVVLHVEAATLQSESEPGRSELEDGTRLSAETSRRLSCDASVVRLGEIPDGSILDVGRKTRTIPPALRRALESRDRGCRFPGCGLRFTDAHHVRHWADGGETKLDNLVLLCRFHHRLVHEDGYTVHFPTGGRASAPDRVDSPDRPISPDQMSTPGPVNAPHRRLYFLDPRMRLLPDVPPPAPPLPSHLAPAPPTPPQPEPAEALVRANQARGVEPDFRTSAARYKREDDVPPIIFTRALEALEELGPVL